MKKLVLSAVVAFAGLVGMNAQSMEALQIGARAGYNLSTIRGDIVDNNDVNSKSGFHIGLFTEIPAGARFSIQPEVMYSTQGATFDVLGEPDLSLQYINVPVLAKFYVADGFNLQAGPQIGSLTGAELGADGVDEVDVTDRLKSTDFGLLFGAGYKTPMGLTIDARYNMGLSNILDEGSDVFENVGTDQNWKNGVFQIGLGYQF